MTRINWKLTKEELEVIVSLLASQATQNPSLQPLYDSAESCLLEHLIIHSPSKHPHAASSEEDVHLRGLITPQTTPDPGCVLSSSSANSRAGATTLSGSNGSESLCLSVKSSKASPRIYSPSSTNSEISVYRSSHRRGLDSLEDLENSLRQDNADDDDVNSLLGQGDEEWPDAGEVDGYGEGEGEDGERERERDGQWDGVLHGEWVGERDGEWDGEWDGDRGSHGGSDDGAPGTGRDGEEEEEEDNEEEEEEYGEEDERPRKRCKVDGDIGVRLPGGTEPVPPRAGGKCPLGSSAPWRGAEAALSTPYSEASRTLIGRLIVAAEQLQPQDATSWAFSIANYLHSPETQCLKLVGLIGMLFSPASLAHPLIGFSISNQDIKQGRPSLTDIYGKEGLEKYLSLRTFILWVSKGRKYASLAAAGSVYILWMIVATHSAKLVYSLSDQDINHICTLLQSPTLDNNFGRLTCNVIIPTLVSLGQQHPLIIEDMFEASNLVDGESPHLDCNNLASTQKVLERLQYNKFHIRERNLAAWGAFLPSLAVNRSFSALYASTTLDPDEEEVMLALVEALEAQQQLIRKLLLPNNSACHILYTSYDPKKNCHLQHINMDLPNQKCLTQQERQNAQKAQDVQSLQTLSSLLASFYNQGEKPKKAYVRIPSGIEGNLPLMVKSQAEELVFLRGCLPSHLRDNLLSKVITIFGNLKERNRKSKENGQWTSIHFDFYNRNSTNGSEAPQDIRLSLLTKEGNKTAQPSLFLPRPSADIKLFPKAYQDLQELFHDVFESLRLQLESLLPLEYKIEKMFADIFPGVDISPVFPFSGIVVNLNVQTLIHRDCKDVLLCLVLAIGDFVDGDICFSDPGLRIQLRNGEWIVFDSQRMAHFNMPYLDCCAVSFIPPWKLDRTQCNRVSLRGSGKDFCGVNSPKSEYAAVGETGHELYRVRVCLILTGVTTKLTSTIHENLRFQIKYETLPYDRHILDFPTYPPLSDRDYEALPSVLENSTESHVLARNSCNRRKRHT
ncbi:hypothetical protein ONZ45_g10968 [Pleurotus djamor]|nr:hypothetical protein ONZ45_g10968 [Pleurotus djamor]